MSNRLIQPIRKIAAASIAAGMIVAWMLASCARAPGTAGTPAVVDSEPQSQQADPGSTKESNRDELHATDPGTVSLASGKVQLVEFFAFW